MESLYNIHNGIQIYFFYYLKQYKGLQSDPKFTFLFDDDVYFGLFGTFLSKTSSKTSQKSLFDYQIWSVLSFKTISDQECICLLSYLK